MPPASKSAPAKKAVPARHAATAAKAAPPTGKIAAGKAKVGKAGTTPDKEPARGKAAVASAAAAKAPSPVKPAPQATVTLKQIAAGLAEGHDLPRQQAESVLAGLVAAVMRNLANGDKVRLTGLGTLQVRDRPARMGRNPATGEAIEIQASRKVTFSAAKELKALV
jgi:DNA-binding protein HU-beta